MNSRLIKKNKTHMSEKELLSVKAREIEKRVRLKYSVSDELALLRQREEKPREFADYHAYVEQVKAEIGQAFSEGET